MFEVNQVLDGLETEWTKSSNPHQVKNLESESLATEIEKHASKRKLILQATGLAHNQGHSFRKSLDPTSQVSVIIFHKISIFHKKGTSRFYEKFRFNSWCRDNWLNYLRGTSVWSMGGTGIENFWKRSSIFFSLKRFAKRPWGKFKSSWKSRAKTLWSQRLVR